MQYAYATCILSEANREINEENLTAVLEAAGCTVQESRVKAIVAALEGVDVEEVTSVELSDVSPRQDESDDGSLPGRFEEPSYADSTDER